MLCSLSELLENSGYAVVGAADGEEAVAIADFFRPDVLVTDFNLPGMDGVTTIEEVRQRHPTLRAILVSGFVSPVTRQRAERQHVERIFQKPVSIVELLRTLHGTD